MQDTRHVRTEDYLTERLRSPPRREPSPSDEVQLRREERQQRLLRNEGRRQALANLNPLMSEMRMDSEWVEYEL